MSSLRKTKKNMHQYQIQKIAFTLFCEARRWLVMEFNFNTKNPEQFVGHAMTRTGESHFFLIDKTGNYYKNVGKKKWEKYDYVLAKEEHDDVCD